MLSETARLYELKHGLLLDGLLEHGKQKTAFKYGFETINKNETTLIHGYMGAQNVTEIETVRPVTVAVGDKVTLVDGKSGKVTNTSVKLLDDTQLRFVSYERADKITRITIQFV